MLDYGTPSPLYLPEKQALCEVTCRHIGAVELRFLGPEPMWGASLQINNCSPAELEEIVRETAIATGQRISGYLSEENGGLTYHISRLPRRVDQAPPEVATLESISSALRDNLVKHGKACDVHLETPADTELQRIVFGLEEGYFESRRLDLIAAIRKGGLSGLAEVREAVTQRLGDLSAYGVAPEKCTTTAEIADTLASISMSKLHSIEEVGAALGEEFTITPANILAVSKEYTYKEPAAVIIAPRSHESFEAVTLLAARFHQARFSLEHLDQMTCYNVEILEESQLSSARFG